MVEGQRIKLTFLHFHIEDDSVCGNDWLLLDIGSFSTKHCGRIDQPWSFISNSNSINIRFRSNDDTRSAGFLALWESTTELPTYPSFNGCESCSFPFVFGDTAFDTCIRVQDVDTQPWCSTDLPLLPVNQGTHIVGNLKISCSDSDSSCPSDPPQTLIASPDYPQSYPNNVDEVKEFE